METYLTTHQIISACIRYCEPYAQYRLLHSLNHLRSELGLRKLGRNFISRVSR
jgi:hypothetical protein